MQTCQTQFFLKEKSNYIGEFSDFGGAKTYVQ